MHAAPRLLPERFQMPANFIQTPVERELLAGFWVFCRNNSLSPSVGLRRVAHYAMTRAGFHTDDYDPDAERRGGFEIWQTKRRRAIEEEGVHPILIARVTPGFKDAFGRFSKSLGLSAPQTLKRIVQQVAEAQPEEPNLEVPKAPKVRYSQVGIRFSADEMAELQQRAAGYKGVGPYLVALARAQLAPDVPQFDRQALQDLYAANRELAAIGRNVNQIAHAVNLDLQQSGQLRRSKVLVDELYGLKNTITAHTERIANLVSASKARWSPA